MSAVALFVLAVLWSCTAHVFAWGGNLGTGDGVITSPQWPNTYWNNQKVEWILGPYPQATSVYFAFTEAEFEGGDGVSFYAERDGSFRWIRLVRAFYSLTPFTIDVGKAGRIKVVFESDEGVVRKGFRLLYSTVACGGVLDSRAGIIKSPQWPFPYPSGLTCEWISMSLPERTSMYFVFTNLQLEGNCQDVVEFYIERGGSFLLLRQVCQESKRLPFSIDAEMGARIKVVFRSDLYESSEGFRLMYSAMQPFYSPSASKTDISCFNGGVLDAPVCQCPPGFSGVYCEKACGGDRYGKDCEEQCSGGIIGCSGKTFPRILQNVLDDSIARTCASGLKGSNCDQVCGRGEYGANCASRCGFCGGQGDCDPFTGHCERGCLPGYHPPYCQQGITHLLKGIEVASITATSFKGSILVTPDNTKGEGSVHFFEVQHKESGGDWTTGVFGKVEPCRTRACPFTVDGLMPNTALLVRALLLNEDLQRYDRVPYLTVRTGGQRQIADLVVTTATPRSLQVAWTSPSKQGPFSVMYECEALLACADVPCKHVNGALVVANTSATLEGLLPCASYRITVARDDEAHSITATTRTTVPDAVVSDLEATHLANTTVLARWREASACAEVNGPLVRYRWELYRDEDVEGHNGTTPALALRSGFTKNMMVMLRDLETLTRYRLHVNIVNIVGGNPQRWAKLPFRTLHTAMADAPLDLAVYRLNGTALWLRWAPPTKGSETLRHYVVTLPAPGGRRNETVPPNTPCPAWPSLTCHVVTGLQPDAEYNISVSAVNEHSDEPGVPATVRASTKVGTPGPPQLLSVKDRSAKSAVLQWQLPDVLNADLHYFEIVVSPKRGASGPPRRIEVGVTEEKLWYESTVTGLVPDGVYSVMVRCGWNGESAQLEINSIPK
ncbi:tyrosine-protein kinase receptor Tie-1-like [Thrips palmi]|uniref:Tyrosine-protein kinase receptor Tie-1-like n=1 Tax=Thrips palmi TaxID=161013 RepID=A0A6P8YVR4_THRPL|nr:tyrosine-protein kinase receptor Tie-1-like [Thrips palmi]